MPAKRSRTLRWRDCLEEIHQRGGAIDVAIARDDEEGPSQQLIWRVSLLGLSKDELVIEEPATMGTPIKLRDGVELVGIMSIGQNRWTFRTENLGRTEAALNAHRTVRAYRLQMPTRVTRTQRRDYYRLAVAGLDLPSVDMWPLNDPRSVVVAERMMDEASRAVQQGQTPVLPDLEDPTVRPDIGPGIVGTLLNVGGGGIGVRIPPEHSQIINRHRVFWLRLDMPGAMTIPILATAKLVHTHLQNDHSIYGGLSFDFSHNIDHQRLVVDEICRFVVQQQRFQLQRRSELGLDEDGQSEAA
jgi:hypothetical protein